MRAEKRAHWKFYETELQVPLGEQNHHGTRTAHTDAAHEEMRFENFSRIRRSVAAEPVSPPLVKTLTIPVPGLPDQTELTTLQPGRGWMGAKQQKREGHLGREPEGRKGRKVIEF